MDWEDLPVGRDLDVLIARMFGWTNIQGEPILRYGEVAEVIWIGTFGGNIKAIPAYSTCSYDAALLGVDPDPAPAPGETLALARCRAWLKENWINE